MRKSSWLSVLVFVFIIVIALQLKVTASNAVCEETCEESFERGKRIIQQEFDACIADSSFLYWPVCKLQRDLLLDANVIDYTACLLFGSDPTPVAFIVTKLQ